MGGDARRCCCLCPCLNDGTTATVSLYSGTSDPCYISEIMDYEYAAQDWLPLDYCYWGWGVYPPEYGSQQRLVVIVWIAGQFYAAICVQQDWNDIGTYYGGNDLVLEDWFVPGGLKLKAIEGIECVDGRLVGDFILDGVGYQEGGIDLTGCQAAVSIG